MEVITIESQAYKNIMDKLNDIYEATLASQKDLYLSSKQVSEMTGFKNDWIHTHKHEIGYLLVDGQLRFKRKDLIEYMDATYTKVTIKKTSLTRLR